MEIGPVRPPDPVERVPPVRTKQAGDPVKTDLDPPAGGDSGGGGDGGGNGKDVPLGCVIAAFIGLAILFAGAWIYYFQHRP